MNKEGYETKRLRIRPWQETDQSPFVRMNQDPKVMRYFPDLYSEERSLKLIDILENHRQQHGFTLWALERKDSGAFIGFTGFVRVHFEAHFTPAVEIAWRLSCENWGMGYATEAARLCLTLAFRDFGLKELVSMTTPANTPSIKVMERLGMTCDPDDDFEHPNVEIASEFKRHILYRLPLPT